MKKRIALLLLFVMVLTLSLPLAVGAAEGKSVWVLSEDLNTLIYGEETYTYYNSAEALGLEVFLESKVICEKEIEGFELQVNELCPDIVCLVGKSTYIFTTDNGKQMIRDMESLKSVYDYGLKTSNSLYEATVPISLIKNIESNGTKTVFSSDALKDCEYYTVWAQDLDRFLAKRYGLIYHYNDEYYFINCTDFDRAYFNDDGSLTSRVGVIYESYKLDRDMVNDLHLVINGLRYTAPYCQYVDYYSDIFEDKDYSALDNNIDNILIVVGVIVVGFVFPIPFLALGLTLPRSKKLGRPKYWYVLGAIAVLWILLSAIISVMLIALF